MVKDASAAKHEPSASLSKTRITSRRTATAGCPGDLTQHGSTAAMKCDDVEARVTAISSELTQLGGSDCGWDVVEHAAYMRLRTQILGPRYKAKPRYGPRSDGKLNQLIVRAATELPGRDEASVEEHEARVSKRETLVRERRELLKHWRGTRQLSASSAIVQVDCLKACTMEEHG